MTFNLLNFLYCPSCRVPFDKIKRNDKSIKNGQTILSCPSCRIAVPVVHGFPLFNESKIFGSKFDEKWLSDIENDKFSNVEDYQGFINEKSKRGVTDLYAAFQPFNESTRALYPLLFLLRETLQPGDVILDTWCRTGWSGELLASLFPKQQVISLWEGDNNVLGYRGFDFWLGVNKRLPNLDIVFSHPDQPLPFDTNSIKIIHGLDSLHRYQQGTFIPECLRVCSDDGVLIFPHIHLSNSEPEPFFERGCHQYHGKEWKSWLDSVLINSSKMGWVIPEAELFEPCDSYTLHDGSNTQHYNALILIANKSNDGKHIRPVMFPHLKGESRLVINPLLLINLNQCNIQISPEKFDGLAKTMLIRHPCYEQYIKKVVGDKLSSKESRLMWHALQQLNLNEISLAMGLPISDAKKIAETLCRREIIHAAPVSKSMSSLQHYYGFTEIVNNSPATFNQLWALSLGKYLDQPVINWLEDGSELTTEDVSYLVDATRAALRSEKLTKGSRIAIVSGHHPAALLTCWAAWLEGVVTVFLDPEESVEKLDGQRNRANAEWLFTDNVKLSKDSVADKKVNFAQEEDNNVEGSSFFNWLEPFLGLPVSSIEVSPCDDALILFTSGTTGDSKGVVHSQQSICHSGWNMAQTYHWANERLLSLGAISTMSGLRNPALAALISTSTILLPGKDTLLSPLVAWEQMGHKKATVLSTVPAWLKGLMPLTERLQKLPTLSILVTGTVLQASLKKMVSEKLGVCVYNYYGLTETGGICLANNGHSKDDDVSIGSPAQSLVQIVNDDGNPVTGDEKGFLRVHSKQLMNRYLDDIDGTTNVLNNGWLMTGDLASWGLEGKVWLAGRVDDLIKLRNGNRFHPIELENILLGFQGVTEAAVTMIIEEQSLIAILVTKRDLKEILMEIRLAVPKALVPNRIICVEKLPYGHNGKLQRNKLENLISQDVINV